MEQERWGDGPLLDWRKIGWFGSHGLVALAFGVASFEWTALLVCAGLAFVTGCLGHSVGVHRLLIHQSFRAPRWL
ncbi:MAG: acyl-CoA desaturase, partial [Myxococcota bacterium]